MYLSHLVPFKRILFVGGADGIIENQYSYLSISSFGRIEFGGSAVIGQDSSIRIDNGVFKIGNNFYCNKNCFIRCTHDILFGDDVLIGYNVSINDNDGHDIYFEGKNDIIDNPIKIENHTWLGVDVTICKLVSIAEGCVVAQNHLLQKK